MKEKARQIQRIVEKLRILAGSIRILADALDSIGTSVSELSEVLVIDEEE